MQGEKPGQKRRWLVAAVFWLGAGLLVVAAMRSISVTNGDRTGPVDQAANGSDLRTIRVKTVDRRPMDPNWRKIEQGDFDLIAGETTSIAAQDLPSERPLVLNLVLPALLPSGDSLPDPIRGSLGWRGVVMRATPSWFRWSRHAAKTRPFALPSLSREWAPIRVRVRVREPVSTLLSDPGRAPSACPSARLVPLPVWRPGWECSRGVSWSRDLRVRRGFR